MAPTVVGPMSRPPGVGTPTTTRWVELGVGVGKAALYVVYERWSKRGASGAPGPIGLDVSLRG